MSLFITGTGTGVGKTVLTGALAAYLKSQGRSFCVYKPIQTGSPDPVHPEDPDTVRRWLGEETPTYCTYCFEDPVAPYVADPHRTIQPEKILADFKSLQRQYEIVLVEGAGGVRVPIAPRFEMIDLIRLLQLPVVVVTHPGLGTMNHTLLTVDALLAERIDVEGVVVSNYPQQIETADIAVQTLLPVLEAFLPVPLLGTLPPLALQSQGFNNPEVLDAVGAFGLWNAAPTALHV